jgi:serine/threonine-protein kinase RsbW
VKPLRLPGTLDSLEPIGKYVLAAAAEAGLDKVAANHLRLSVDEIATNAVVHGYNEAGRTGDLVVEATLDDTSLAVCLEDTGAEFDPHSVAAPIDMNKPLGERQIGGLGIYLAIEGVDELRYERRGDRNHYTFIVHRPAASVG